MNKTKITLSVLLILIHFSIIAQTLRKVETYYDPLSRTKIHEAYTTLSTPPYLIHGTYKKWDQYGTLENEIQFSNGKKNGVSKTYNGTGVAQLSGRKDIMGKVAYISHYLNDELNGLDQKFEYPNGRQQMVLQKTWVKGKQIKVEEWYEDGKPYSIATENGLNVTWYPNGKKTSEVNKKNGIEDGKVTEWYENGQIAFSGTFKNGNMVGETIVYNEKGTVIKRLSYDPITFKGTRTIEYYPTGKVKWDRIATDDTHYVMTTYDSLKGYKKIVKEWIDNPNKTDGSLLQHGMMIEYYETGEPWTEVNYANGKYEGPYKVLTKSGEALSEGLVTNGKKVGKWKSHYTQDWEEAYTKEDAAFYRIIDFEDGNLKQWSTVDYYVTGEKQFEGTLVQENPDKITGPAKYYYLNGQISEEGLFDFSGRTGEWKFYHENGKPKATGYFNRDKETGQWNFFDEQGNLTETKTF